MYKERNVDYKDQMSPQEQIDFSLNYINIIGEENLKPYVENIKEDNVVAVILANHLSLLDGGHISRVTKKINELLSPEKKLKGFYMPYAMTINTGDQGSGPKEYFDIMNQCCLENNLILMPVLRPEDYKKMLDKIKKDYPHDKEAQKKAKKELHKLVEISRKSVEIIEEGIFKDKAYGLAFFPEGTTEGGRKDKETGEIKGSQKAVRDNMFDNFFDKYHPFNKFCTLCVTLEDTNEHYSPNYYTFDNNSPVPKMIIGETLTNEDLMNYMNYSPSDRALVKIIKKFSKKIRGYYGKIIDHFQI